MADFQKLFWAISRDQKECYEEREKFLADIIHRYIKNASSLFGTEFRRGLDVGCGTGEFTKRFSDRTGIKFMGVDPSPPKNSGGIRIVQAYADRLPFADKSYDMITLISVFEHIKPEKRFVSLQEIYRVLSDKGILIIQIPNAKSLIDAHSLLPFFNYLPRTLQEMYAGLLYRKKIDYFTIKKDFLKSLCQKAGFRLAHEMIFHYPKEVVPRVARIIPFLRVSFPIFFFKKGIHKI
jgi:ubiquinone/menaquinone biosynthesis C-methylase UbiE